MIINGTSKNIARNDNDDDRMVAIKIEWGVSKLKKTSFKTLFKLV